MSAGLVGEIHVYTSIFVSFSIYCLLRFSVYQFIYVSLSFLITNNTLDQKKNILTKKGHKNIAD